VSPFGFGEFFGRNGRGIAAGMRLVNVWWLVRSRRLLSARTIVDLKEVVS
jgi:hypothetical protein